MLDSNILFALIEIEGAPKCMLQLAIYLKKKKVDISLISPRTGPLHDTYRVLGVPVEIRPEFLFHGNERSIITKYGSPDGKLYISRLVVDMDI